MDEPELLDVLPPLFLPSVEPDEVLREGLEVRDEEDELELREGLEVLDEEEDPELREEELELLELELLDEEPELREPELRDEEPELREPELRDVELPPLRRVCANVSLRSPTKMNAISENAK